MEIIVTTKISLFHPFNHFKPQAPIHTKCPAIANAAKIFATPTPLFFTFSLTDARTIAKARDTIVPQYNCWIIGRLVAVFVIFSFKLIIINNNETRIVAPNENLSDASL